MVLRINGERFAVPSDGARSAAVEKLASGAVFTQASEDADRAIDAVLGGGAMARITRGRRLDAFDRLTLAVFICREYFRKVDIIGRHT